MDNFISYQRELALLCVGRKSVVCHFFMMSARADSSLGYCFGRAFSTQLVIDPWVWFSKFPNWDPGRYELKYCFFSTMRFWIYFFCPSPDSYFASLSYTFAVEKLDQCIEGKASTVLGSKFCVFLLTGICISC